MPDTISSIVKFNGEVILHFLFKMSAIYLVYIAYVIVVYEVYLPRLVIRSYCARDRLQFHLSRLNCFWHSLVATVVASISACADPLPCRQRRTWRRSKPIKLQDNWSPGMLLGSGPIVTSSSTPTGSASSGCFAVYLRTIEILDAPWGKNTNISQFLGISEI